MYERLFVCEECKVSYTMTYETEQGMKNARRTRCPKCQRVHELNRKRKKRSQSVVSEVLTDDSMSEDPKNDVLPAVFEDLPVIESETGLKQAVLVEKTEENAPQIDFQEDTAENLTMDLSKNDESAAISAEIKPSGKKEPPKQAYKTNHSPDILASMGQRISILTGQKKETDSLRDAVAYGRHYRKGG